MNLALALEDRLSWSDSKKIELSLTATQPAMAANGEHICIAYKGISNRQIWVLATWDGGLNWTSPCLLEQHQTPTAPAISVLNDQFLMAYQQIQSNHIALATSRDGLKWSKAKTLPQFQTTEGPVITATDGLAVMAWKDKTSNDLLISVSRDGITWPFHWVLDQVSSTCKPALANNGRQLMLAWIDDHKNIRTAISGNGLKWSEATVLPGHHAHSGIALCFQPAVGMWCMSALEDIDSHNLWVSWSENGMDWTPPAILPEKKTDCPPSVIPMDESFCMAFPDEDHRICTSVLEG